MRSCITMSAVASLLLAAGGPNPEPENAPPVPGWSFATESSGIPRNQDAAGFAAGVDREVAHGGHASVSIRSIVAEAHFWAVTLGVDDASLEVVDPAKVPATEGATVRPLDPAKRARELKESLPSTPDRPENLDFER